MTYHKVVTDGLKKKKKEIQKRDGHNVCKTNLEQNCKKRFPFEFPTELTFRFRL